MTSRKAQHLQHRILQKLGVILQREAKDPRFERVTITEVHLAKDLSYAVVRYSCFQSNQDPQELNASLNKAAGFLSHILARSLKTRATPKLRFEYDPGFDYAQEIDIALAKIRNDEA